MNAYAPPPRGWLYGFVVAITAFWISGLSWEAFRNHEIGLVRLAGIVTLLISMGTIAWQALTDTNYRTARTTLIARRVILPIGLALIIIGRYLP
ncbi:MAG TPA: hypothetical protein VGO33_10030 [Gemmatimonadaceae bacterium]|jgi:hypothetical protein|nr:hypothetical protein [Gemmatimonadaceae bacterium]